MAATSRIQTIERATSRTWDQWLRFMDGVGAPDLSHHEIATHVLLELDGKIDSPAWWAQSVTVAYEQHIGRRLPGQRPDGTFQTSVSRATQLGMHDLIDRWARFAGDDPDVRAVTAAEPKVSGTDKRITWRTKGHDGSDIRVTSEPKKDGTASIIAVQMGLQTSDLNAEARERWAAILERFVAALPGL